MEIAWDSHCRCIVVEGSADVVDLLSLTHAADSSRARDGNFSPLLSLSCVGSKFCEIVFVRQQRLDSRLAPVNDVTMRVKIIAYSSRYSTHSTYEFVWISCIPVPNSITDSCSQNSVLTYNVCPHSRLRYVPATYVARSEILAETRTTVQTFS